MDATKSNPNGVILKRQLGLLHGICIICGLVIGGGIYVSPKGVLQYTGSYGLAIIIWVIASFISTLGALCYAELGTTFPRSGGTYTYIDEMFGSLPSFFYLWCCVNVTRPSFNAVKCILFGQYVIKLFYDDQLPGVATKLIGICMLWLVTCMNIIKVKWSANGQSAFVTITTGILLLISIFGVTHLVKGNTEYLTGDQVFEGTSYNVKDIVLAVYSGLYAFGGWHALNCVTEELKDPVRNLPRAIIMAMIVTTTLYITVNISYFSVLGVNGVMESVAVGVDFAKHIMGPMTWFIPFGVSIATVASYNSAALIGSRVVFAGSRRGHFPKILGLIHIKFLSPITALLHQAILTTILCTFSDIYSLIEMVMFIQTLFLSLSVAGMIYYKLKYPEMNRPIKVPLFIPIIYLIITLYLLVVPLIFKVTTVLAGIALVLGTGIPYYILLQLWDKGYAPQNVQKIYKKIVSVVQKVLYCCVQEGEVDF